MLSVTRSPLTSPALRTVMSASSRVSFPFESTPSTTPRPLVAPGPGPRVELPSSPRTPDLSPNRLGSPNFRGYFSLGVSSPSRSGLQALRSPVFLAPPQIVVHTPPVSLIEKPSKFSEMAQVERKSECLKLDSASSNRNISLTCEQPAEPEARGRHRPSFKLDIPRPNIVREDSFEAVAFAGITFTPGTPCKLEWSDSYDSVVTLKPTKGRVSTPYPKSEVEGEWIDNVDDAIRDDVQTRLARLL